MLAALLLASSMASAPSMLLHPLVALPAAAGGIDLAKRYPATLDFVEGALGHEWKCEAEDVFALSAVKLAWSVGGQKLAVETGPAQLVVGREGTNALWAAVLPDKPGRLATSLPGDGGVVYNVWLRMNPALIGELFPAATVTKAGSPAALLWGRRLATWKMRASWQADDLPVVPWKQSIVVDCETQGGARRFYSVDTKKPELRYEPAFEKRGLPPMAPITKDDALAAFDEVANAFDLEYAKFVLHPEYDWAKAVAALRKRAAGARANFEVGALLAELLAPLGDLHVDVTVGDEWIPAATRVRPRNASWDGSRAMLASVVDTKHDCIYGRSKDDVGYLNIVALSDQALPAAADEALEALHDCFALIVDLRFNGGGDELLAQKVAARFLDQERIYSVNRYRAGPKHDQLGPWLERKLAPRGPWRFESPVIVLQGQRTLSSAESMALMLAQCPQATTMGDKTGGSSGNPRMVETKGAIKVRLPRWDDRDPKQGVIEGKGVEPKLRVDAKPQEFTSTRDPVLEKAFEKLREQPEDERKAGKRG